MSIGSVLFAQPWVLLGLVLLPVIWLLLRASPPPPTETDLPSLRLLDQVTSPEETPERTPWWVILLRLTTAALVIVGFAEPSWSPATDSARQDQGPALIVVDDGWPSAARWGDFVETASGVIAEQARKGRDIHLMFTADRRRPLPIEEPLTGREARSLIRSHIPASWTPDRRDAAQRLDASDVDPAVTVWITDGLSADKSGVLAEALAGRGSLEIRLLPPRGGYAITDLRRGGSRAEIDLERASGGPEEDVSVFAQSRDGISIASAQTSFAAGQRATTVTLTVPGLFLDETFAYRIAQSASAGAVWLTDFSDRRPRVGLVDSGEQGQPLLQEFHYVHQALVPHAEISDGPLSDLLDAQPDALVLGDGRISDPVEAQKLEEWIDSGGTLIRFAGAHLAAEADEFIPVKLRPASRALGGALAWQIPQKLAAMPEESPFAGIAAPDNAVVSQQILAEPGPDLDARVWARLEDGTPLVTAERRGDGVVVLFHVTATPSWSDLPYTPAFGDMLARAATAGRGFGGPEAQTTDGNVTLVPERMLDAFGQTAAPDGETQPVAQSVFASVVPGSRSPPGLYRGPLGLRALNAARVSLSPIALWPDTATLVRDGSTASNWRDLRGWSLSLALILLTIDLAVTVLLSGLGGMVRRVAAICVSALMAGAVLAPAADASSDDKLSEAALALRFAYVTTEDRRNDEITRAGLTGLGRQLYQRTAVEPAPPHGIDLATDPLELYPLIVYAPTRDTRPLSAKAAAALNRYLRTGGALLVDLRDAVTGERTSSHLSTILKGVDAPPLSPLPRDHVLTRSFYLIDDVSGRVKGAQLWLDTPEPGDPRSGDGVASLFIGGGDWVGAWAVDQRGKPMLPMDGGYTAREYAYRFGINLVMYVLTGNYKEDQVHLPDLLKRLGRDVPSPPDTDR